MPLRCACSRPRSSARYGHGSIVRLPCSLDHLARTYVEWTLHSMSTDFPYKYRRLIAAEAAVTCQRCALLCRDMGISKYVSAL